MCQPHQKSWIKVKPRIQVTIDIGGLAAKQIQSFVQQNITQKSHKQKDENKPITSPGINLTFHSHSQHFLSFHHKHSNHLHFFRIRHRIGSDNLLHDRQCAHKALIRECSSESFRTTKQLGESSM